MRLLQYLFLLFYVYKIEKYIHIFKCLSHRDEKILQVSMREISVSLKEIEKKSTEVKWRTIFGHVCPAKSFTPLLFHNLDVDLVLLAFVSGQFEVLLCDLPVIILRV